MKRRGRMPWPRLARVAFWDGVRAGLGVREAAEAAGVSADGGGWFREAGGVKGNGRGAAGDGPVPVGLASGRRSRSGWRQGLALREIARAAGPGARRR